ncbi:MAG: hypothetical protein AB7T19_17765, partial [Planctomycetota bacterium]
GQPNTTSDDRVWNRAALESGGDTPGPGDRALATLLLVHVLAMNGAVHDAIECVEPGDLVAAADGLAFLGLGETSDFYRGASADPVPTTWDDDTEVAESDRYADLIPDDSHPVAEFRQVYRERPELFAPLGPS